jgi:hypothetical protein
MERRRSFLVGLLEPSRLAARWTRIVFSRMSDHRMSWAISFHRAVGKLATDNWRTPRYVTGRYTVPQVGSGHRRHPIAINEIPIPEGQAMIDVELTKFGEVEPDVSLEVRVDTIKLTFDLLVELDLTERPSYNREKLLAYDALLCGWCLEIRGTRRWARGRWCGSCAGTSDRCWDAPKSPTKC